MQANQIRWKRWAGGVAGAVALYTVLGGLLLPALIRDQLPKLAESTLQRRASVGDLSFNPYTLRLQASGLRLTEADGAPLFAVGHLVVELDWRSLLRRAWSFGEIRVTEPVVSLAVAADGRFNIGELIATLNREPKPESSGLPRLVIRQFALERGKVEMNDRRAGYAESFTPIDIALTKLSTLPDEHGDYTFSADATHGGKLHWKASAGLNPIAGSGLLTLENVALPGLTAYMKSFTHATVADGKLSATLPYRYSYADGKFDASLNGAALALRDLALVRDGAGPAFATLKLFELRNINADLAQRSANVGEAKVEDGKLALRRDANGVIDLSTLMVASAPAAAVPTAPAASASPWKVQLRQVAVDRLAFSAIDETVRPAVTLSAEQLKLRLKLDAQQGAAGIRLNIADAAFSLADLTLASGGQTPFKLVQLGFDGGTLDLAQKQATVGRLYADGGQFDLSRDGKGQFTILSRLPDFSAGSGAAAPAATSKDGVWDAKVGSVEISHFGAAFADAATGIRSTLQDFRLKIDGASSDLKQAIRFDTALGLREGGQLSAQGKLVPASGALDATLLVKQLALAPVQPLLAQYVKLNIAGGNINAKGRLTTGAGSEKSPALTYVGSFDVASLALKEGDGDLFGSWKSLRADTLNLSVTPNRLEIPELRVVEPNATLIIEDDRSFNASRLLVQSAAKSDAAITPATPAVAPAGEAFPVRVRRMRFQNAKLDFTDLSLRPQFGAKIYELNGVITGLSTRGDARSQIELDGRVDDFGMARVRGQLNPFVPTDNTDLNVVFKNVDLISASPYSMKFAGYKIADGKISLDLQYKVRQRQLKGQNQIVFDKLTLGERIDSPDALKLPLELALAILRDSDGRIELGLPVAGDMNDPQFSYGGLVWKAIGNVLGKIVTSPFRALGSLLGMAADKLESIDFDAGSAALLPPEREKLNQIATIMAQRSQLKLTVPGQYSEEADGAALRVRAVRRAIAGRAGIKLEAGEEPGPMSLASSKVRGAMRELYTERFGAAALDQQKAAAEAAGATADKAAAAASPKKLAVWQRLGKLVQGEPQVADATAFYEGLQRGLERGEPLGADVLARLGTSRAAAIVAALKEAGVDPASAVAGPVEKSSVAVGKPVPVKLGLAAK